MHYFLKGQKNGKPHFHGLMNSHIFFDVDNLTWRLQSLRDPKKFLLLAHPTGSTIPIGTHNWEVGSKSAVCDKRMGETHELTFSICYPDKYTCNDGPCIGRRMVSFLKLAQFGLGYREFRLFVD